MSVAEFFSQPLWHRLSLTLVHFLWQGLAVAMAVCAAVWVLRLKHGKPRYAAYLVAFAAMAVAPPVTFVALGAPTASVPLAPQPALQIESAAPIPRAVPAQAPGQLNEDTLPIIGSTYRAPLRQKVATVLQASLPWALVGWMSGVLTLSVRLLLGFLGIRRWRRDLEPLVDDLDARVARLSDRLGLRDFSRVFVSRRAQEVVALGYLRPLVLLPAALMMQMPPEMLEAIIAHELAHIRRLDLWVNLAQRIVETLLFYHPAVWWLSARLRRERELCCDELAVETTGERLVYASALEQVGRIRLGVGQPGLALGFGQERRSTLGRVRYILGLPPTAADSRYWLAGVIAFMVLGIFMMHVLSSLTARAETESTPKMVNAEGTPTSNDLPQGWSLDYDDGLRPNGATTWLSEMASDLSSLEFSPTGLRLSDTSWSNEKYEFEIRSTERESRGMVQMRMDQPGNQTGRMTLKPGRYRLEYTRSFGTPEGNFRVRSGPFALDLPEPGMYTLRFAPRLGNAEIRGSLGGCYAVNFERIDGGFRVAGLMYQNAARQYLLNGLPAGTYRLSAVTQDDHGNNLVSQAQATVKAEEKLTVDIAPPPRGDCSLQGVIAGRRGTYWTPTPTPQQTDPQWFVLIRTRGSGPVEQADAYEAQTMDSVYVVRGHNLVQESEDRATYAIHGVAPGAYTVTVIEHPWYQGLPVERQQSRSLTLRPGATAVLDFDLSDAAPFPPARTAQAQTGDKAMDLDDVMAKYEAAREAAPGRYLMVIKSERDLYITCRDGDRLYRAEYGFSGPVYAGRRIDLEAMAQERTRAGDTIASMLAWAGTQTPQNAEVYDGGQGCSLWPDGYGHLRSGRAAGPRSGGLDYLALPTLQRYGWPDLGPARATRRLVPDDSYALDNGLICIEEQHQVTNSRTGEVTEATRFYLNPARDYICQRRHESLQDHDYAEEVTRYERTAGGQWYPLQIDEFGYRHSLQPLTATPTAVNVVSLDTNPMFPEDIFKPDALLARYAAQIVPHQAARPPARGAKPNASQVRVAGRVLAGETHQPIARALVRVAVPAADMRFARVPSKQITQEDGTKSDLYETKTDANGQFELLIPRTGAADAFSVDAMAPGYGTAAGTFHSGGDHPQLAQLSFGGPMASISSNLTILLPRAAYIAGTARDSTGAPAAGVQVFGQMRSNTSSYGIARTQTDAQGRFEIFDFPLQKESDEKAQLMFQSPIAVPITLSDFYELSAEKRAALEVILPRGFKITGVLLNADGRPAPGVLVQAVDGFPIKETTTDSNGRFELAGLRPGPYHLRAHAMDINQKVVQPIAYLPDGDQNVTLKMNRIEIKGPLRPVTLFGMQLVDVTPELRQVYDLGNPDAVMILDPGANHRRLNIGELRKGYCFWQIGDKSITSLKEMVAELLHQLAPSWTGQQSQIARPPRRVRVVYTKPGSANTQYLVLTQNDVAELKQVAAQLGIAPADSNK